MNNITEYVKWRGDISFEREPMCEADYLVFAELAYCNFDGIVGEKHSDSVTVGSAVKKYIERENDKKLSAQKELFLLEVIESERFSQLRICGYSDIFNSEPRNEQQFAAVTFLSDGENAAYFTVAAFRGTDSTLVGWKEDFNMAFSDAVPSQIEAVRYLELTAAAFPDRGIYVCGHSKGGNLAVYSSAFCTVSVQERIIGVRNLDGPGFSRTIIERDGFANILERTETIVPASSIVGILLEHAEEFTVIKSFASPFPLQHDPFTWEIVRCSYVPVENISDISKYLDETLRIWVESMSPDMREKLVNGIFSVAEATGERDIRDVFSRKNLRAMMNAVRKLDRETASVIMTAAIKLDAAAKNRFPQFIKNIFDND